MQDLHGLTQEQLLLHAKIKEIKVQYGRYRICGTIQADENTLTMLRRLQEMRQRTPAATAIRLLM